MGKQGNESLDDAEISAVTKRCEISKVFMLGQDTVTNSEKEEDLWTNHQINDVRKPVKNI